MKQKIKLLLIVTIYALTAHGQKPFTLSGKFDTLQKDTLTLVAWPYLLSGRKKDVLPQTKQIAVLQNGRFTFTVTGIDKPFYFILDRNVQGRRKSILNFFIAEPGDSIDIESSKGALSFTGNNRANFEYQYSVAKAFPALAKQFGVYWVLDSTNYMEYIKITTVNRIAMLDVQLKELEKWQGNISPDVYTALYADLIGRAGTMLYASYDAAVNREVKKYFGNSLKLEKNTRELRENFNGALTNPYFTKEQPMGKMAAREYLAFLAAKATFCEGCTTQQKAQNLMEIDTGNGKYHDHVITLYLLNEYDVLDGNTKLIDKAKSLITDELCLQVLSDIAHAITGSYIQAFSLEDVSKKTRYLKEFSNKVTIIDFWFTGCDGCITFYQQTLSELKKKYTDTSRYVFLSVCIDKDRSRWLNSISKNIYTSPESINLYTNGKGNEDPIIKSLKVTFYPTYVVIDKTGQIQLVSSRQHTYETLSVLLDKLNNE